MRLTVKNKEGKLIGAVAFTSHNLPVVEDATSEALDAVLTEILERGITRYKDIPHEGKLVMIEESVSKDDPTFPLAVKETLERQGFDVSIDHPEIIAEITEFLRDSEEDEETTALIRELPKLSYLELTYILGKLRAMK